MYLVLEYCSNGELFDIIACTGKFDEKYTRTLFLQILQGIEAIHNSGISHRDLKPENILFDDNFNLKIADFGFSILLSGRDNTGKL